MARVSSAAARTRGLVEPQRTLGLRHRRRVSGVGDRHGIDEGCRIDNCLHSLFGASKLAADILVQENRLDEAKDAFLRIPELFPTAQRVPWALYRVALLEIEMDNLDGAREYLNRVVNTYPSSGVAELARERLQEIG